MQKNTVKTMIGGLVCLVLFNIGCGPGIGTNTDNADDAVPIRDEEGASLTRDELVERLATGDWAAEPVHDEDGAVLEIVVRQTRARSMRIPPGMEPPPGAMVIDGSAPIRTEDGESLSFEEFMTRMGSGGWRPEPVLGEDGEVVEIVVIKDDSASAQHGPPPEGVLDNGALSKRWLGQPLPNLNLTTIDGKSLGPSDLESRVVVLNFWFRACKPCLMEIPELNEMVEALGGEDVVFVSLTFDNEDEAREVLDSHDFAYEVVADALKLHQEFAVQSYPTHLVFDRDHNCTAALSGYTPGIGNMLKNEVVNALEGKFVAH